MIRALKRTCDMRYFLILLLFPTISFASARDDLESTTFKPDVHWSVEGGKVVDVCDNYRNGSWQYRSCRREAQKKFKSLCAKYKKEYSSSGGSKRDNAYANKQIYCSSFRP